MNRIFDGLQAIGIGFLIAICGLFYMIFRAKWESKWELGEKNEVPKLQEERKASSIGEITRRNRIRRKRITYRRKRRRK